MKPSSCGAKAWLLLLGLCLIHGEAADTAEQPPSSAALRHSPQAVKDSWERLPVVERVYGEHNTDVRTNIRRVEEAMTRYQTGVPPDPAHEVPYEKHPYDEKNRRRLQQTGNVTEIDGSSRFQPIRMHFETVALNQMREQATENAAKIECKC